MANLNDMLDLNQMADNGQLAAAGSAVGGAVGAAFGQPLAGSMIGSAVGTMAASLIPQYSHVRGSVSGINMVTMKQKPYMLMIVEPTDEAAKAISDQCCYYGCATARTEPLNIPNYMYENHAFIQGDLHYNGSIPLDKFKVINQIFNQGVHILNE